MSARSADVGGDRPRIPGIDTRRSQTPTRSLARCMLRHRGLVLRTGACAAGMAVISAVLPIALAEGLSRGLTGGPGQVTALMAVVGAVGVLVWAINRWRTYLTRCLVAQVVLDLRLEAMEASLRHGPDYYDRNGRAAAVSRCTDDLDQFDSNAFSLLELLQQVLVILILLPVMLAIDWSLTLVVAVFAVAIVLTIAVVRRLSQRASAAAAKASESLSLAVSELVRGLPTLRSFDAAEVIAARVTARNQRVHEHVVRADTAATALQPLLSAVIGLAMATLVLGGGLLERAGLLSISAWYLFILAADRISWLLSTSGSIASQWQAIRTTAQRAFDLIESAPGPEASSRRLRAHPGGSAGGLAVAIDDLTLRYPSGVQALRGVTLHIPAGTHVGLVGHSGAGKSSLLKALARLYQPEAGVIRLDGVPLPEIPESDLRREVAYVPQRPQLFAGTVADNLRLVDATASDDELAATVAEAGLASWLAQLPDGLDTEVGTGGHRLSLGQQQVVGLLRGLVKEPRLVLFDEPVANVDIATERHLRPAVRALLTTATCIVIAHRVETVTALDLIAVMRNGLVVETGTHQSLLDKGGEYAALHHDYLRGVADVRS